MKSDEYAELKAEIEEIRTTVIDLIDYIQGLQITSSSKM